MDVLRSDKAAGQILNCLADGTRDGGNQRSPTEGAPGGSSSEPRASHQARVGAVECEHLGNPNRSGPTRWHPPVGVHQICSGGHFTFRREPQTAPEPQQKSPSAWAPEPGGKGIL